MKAAVTHPHDNDRWDAVEEATELLLEGNHEAALTALERCQSRFVVSFQQQLGRFFHRIPAVIVMGMCHSRLHSSKTQPATSPPAQVHHRDTVTDSTWSWASADAQDQVESVTVSR